LKFSRYGVGELQPHGGKQVRRHENNSLVSVRRPSQARSSWLLGKPMVNLSLKCILRGQHNIAMTEKGKPGSGEVRVRQSHAPFPPWRLDRVTNLFLRPFDNLF
jgi:hypothetical protein